MTGFTRLVLSALAFFAIQQSTLAATSSPPPAPDAVVAEQALETIAPYVARFGRSRPLIAVVGENAGTVLSDFVIPYGVLAQSGVADVLSVATQTGVLKIAPLTINPDHTVATFDQLYPDGADYVIVPAVAKRDDPTLVAWVAAQARKGATMVSICNGSLVLAKAGITRGHRATGHWSTYRARLADFPGTQWQKDRRYVADRKVISSAGITAAIPLSIALVEAIGGSARAQALAAQLGVGYWGPRHDSDAFSLGLGDWVAALKASLFHAREDLGVPVASGVDEIALALTAEAYDATLRSRVYSVAQSAAPVRTRGGLMLVPDRVAGQGQQVDRLLPEWDGTPSGQVPDKILIDIHDRFGAAAARFVVLEWEYPWQAGTNTKSN